MLKKYLLLGLLIIALAGCDAASAGRFVSPITATKPTPTPEPTCCYVDWNWGGATLQICGIDPWQWCDGLRAYGYRDHGIMFYPSSGVSNESIMCEFESADFYYAIWDEPGWEAGGEFCAFLASIDVLP